MSDAWEIVLAAAREAERAAPPHPPVDLAIDGVRLAWTPAEGWTSALTPGDTRKALIDLYLPICSATPARPITVGHLGQSLDGFIATHAGSRSG